MRKPLGECTMEKPKLDYFKQLFVKMIEHEFDGPYLTIVKNGDDVDLAIQEREVAMMRRLQGRRSFYLKKIFNSLRRIREGNFGECCECGEEIQIARLIARPTADLCIKCKDEEEREESRLLYKDRSHTFGRVV